MNSSATSEYQIVTTSATPYEVNSSIYSGTGTSTTVSYHQMMMDQSQQPSQTTQEASYLATTSASVVVTQYDSQYAAVKMTTASKMSIDEGDDNHENAHDTKRVKLENNNHQEQGQQQTSNDHNGTIVKSEDDQPQYHDFYNDMDDNLCSNGLESHDFLSNLEVDTEPKFKVEEEHSEDGVLQIQQQSVVTSESSSVPPTSVASGDNSSAPVWYQNSPAPSTPSSIVSGNGGNTQTASLVQHQDNQSPSSVPPPTSQGSTNQSEPCAPRNRTTDESNSTSSTPTNGSDVERSATPQQPRSSKFHFLGLNDNDESSRQTICPLCDNTRSFCSSSSVTRHLRSVHKLLDLIETKQCYCLICHAFQEDLNAFYTHLQGEHRIMIANSELFFSKHHFNSFDDFMHWKEKELQGQTGCRYERCFSYDYPRSVYFKCSGIQLESEKNTEGNSTGIMNLKFTHAPEENKQVQGITTVLDNTCDARMYPCTSSIRIVFRNNGVDVNFIQLHLGHTLQAQQSQQPVAAPVPTIQPPPQLQQIAPQQQLIRVQQPIQMQQPKPSPQPQVLNTTQQQTTMQQPQQIIVPTLVNLSAPNQVFLTQGGAQLTNHGTPTAIKLEQSDHHSLAQVQHVSQQQQHSVVHQQNKRANASTQSNTLSAAYAAAAANVQVFGDQGTALLGATNAPNGVVATTAGTMATSETGYQLMTADSSSSTEHTTVVGANATATANGGGLMIVSLEKGLEMVQERLRPRKDQLRGLFEQLLSACLTDADYDLIDSTLRNLIGVNVQTGNEQKPQTVKIEYNQ